MKANVQKIDLWEEKGKAGQKIGQSFEFETRREIKIPWLCGRSPAK